MRLNIPRRFAGAGADSRTGWSGGGGEASGESGMEGGQRKRQLGEARLGRKVQTTFGIFSELTVVHGENAVRGVEVVVVVRRRDDRLSLALQCGENIVVEVLTKRGVLVGGPLVEDEDGLVLDEDGDQREAFTLAGRQIDVGKAAFVESRFFSQLHVVN